VAAMDAAEGLALAVLGVLDLAAHIFSFSLREVVQINTEYAVAQAPSPSHHGFFDCPHRLARRSAEVLRTTGRFCKRVTRRQGL
jgi:hypothetical protein